MAQEYILMDSSAAALAFNLEIIPKEFKKHYLRCPVKYLSQTEDVLRSKIREHCNEHGLNFGTLVKMRLAFWNEYEKAARANRHMDLAKIYVSPLCMELKIERNRHEALFKILEDIPALIAWIVCPLEGFLLTLKEAEFILHEQIIKIVSRSAIDPITGKADSRWASNLIHLYEVIQNRLYGAPTQTQNITSEQKNLNVNLSGKLSDAPVITDMAELDRRLKEIQAKREALQNPARTIEIDQDKLISGKSLTDKE